MYLYIVLRSNTHKLSDLIRYYKKKNKLETGINSTRIVNSWPKVVGEIIAKKTTRIEVINRKLYVQINSSVVRNELLLLKGDLIRRLNEEAGHNEISDIYFR